jgi:hypothetical protein
MYDRNPVRPGAGVRSMSRSSSAILLLLCAISLSAWAEPRTRLTQAAIDAELKTRAGRYLSRKQLVVDYYRIGRRLAFGLPVGEIPRPGLPVPGIPDYPWEIWFSWELEERVNALGWAAQWFGDKEAAAAGTAELRAIVRWPEFTTTGRIDLCLGHVARTLCQAYTSWSWLDPETRAAIRNALDRLVVQSAPWVDARYPAELTSRQILASREPYTSVHNIPFIGLIGAAQAANAIGSNACQGLNRRVASLLEVLFELKRQGYSEGVGYDGYLMDFVAGWIQSLPAAERDPVLRRFELASTIDSSYMLGVPGDLAQVAEIADVEPLQMPFHIAAQARLQQLQPTRLRAWYLAQIRPGAVRSDALACLRQLAPRLSLDTTVPGGGLFDARYAMVLRSGWTDADLAVAIATSNSPAGHIHSDFGSITIGLDGRWLIADPGYQQYMPGAEREFTLGPSAHNTPVVNGKSEQLKAGRVVQLSRLAEDTFRIKLDITGCYPPDAGATRVIRTVWLAGDNLVVLADEIQNANGTATYSWHGSPQAAWRIRDNWAMLYAEPGTVLWYTSPSCDISEARLERLAGSRGQLTLMASARPGPAIWWVFSRGASPPEIEYPQDGRLVRISGRQFAID